MEIKRFDKFMNENLGNIPEIEYDDLLSIRDKDVIIICVEGVGAGVYLSPGQYSPPFISSDSLSKLFSPMKHAMLVISSEDTWASMPASARNNFSIIRTDKGIYDKISGGNFYQMWY